MITRNLIHGVLFNSDKLGQGWGSTYKPTLDTEAVAYDTIVDETVEPLIIQQGSNHEYQSNRSLESQNYRG